MNTFSKSLSMLALSLFVTHCGAIEDYLNDPENAEALDLSMLFDLTDDQADVTVGTEEDQAIVALFRDRQEALRLQVADCAGFGDEARAFEESKQALIDQGMSKEQIKAQLKEEHDALRSLIEQNKETVRACHEEAKSSEAGLALAAGLDACFAGDDSHEARESHESEDHHSSDHELHDDSDDDSFSLSKKRKRKGHGVMGHKVPSLEYATFDSVACQDWIAANGS